MLIKMSKKNIQSTGKRKSAIARATLHTGGSGIIRINHQILDAINPRLAKDRIMEPLLLSGDLWKEVDINVNVHGGGWQGQTEAVRSAIARALAEHNKKLREIFLGYDRHLIVWDTRFKETRKPNDSKARKSRQKSYR